MPERTYGDVYCDVLFKINQINFVDKNNHVVEVVEYKEMTQHFNLETKKEGRMRKFFLICGTIMLAMAACGIIDIVEAFQMIGKYDLAWLQCVQSILLPLLLVVTGIGAISFYKDKGPFRKWIKPLGIISLALNVIQIIFFAVLFNKIGNNAIKVITLTCINTVISALYIWCSIYLDKIHTRNSLNIVKKQNEKDNKKLGAKH